MSQNEYIADERLDAMISIQEGIAEDAVRGNETVHKLDSEILSALKELKEYRDIGPTPEQLKEVDRLYMEKCREVDGLNEAIRNICRNLSTKEFTDGDTYECLLSLSLPFAPGGKSMVEPHTMWKLEKIAEDGWFVLHSLEKPEREIQTKYLNFVVSFKKVQETGK